MGLRGVGVDGGSGLSAKVAEAGVKIDGADAVRALHARELQTAPDALDVIGLHWKNCRRFVMRNKNAMVEQRR